MASELLDVIVRINLVLAAAIAIVMALRLPMRRLFGARVAYALWLLPLLAATMCFVPGREVEVMLDLAQLRTPTEGAATGPDHGPLFMWLWVGGAVLSLAVLMLRQARFMQGLGRLSARNDLGAHVHAAQSSTHGPAIVGVWPPLIVTPSDFDERFDAEERRIVLAHERAHLAHGDPWINAVVLALQCINWFNPLVHIGARALRNDQELACDAAVLGNADGARRRYAEAMLKTHLAAAVPIGCAWPPSNLNAMKERIAMLKRNLPTRTQTLAGVSVIALAAAGACAAAWAVQPPHVITTLATPSTAQESVRPLAPDPWTPAAAHGDDLVGGDDDDESLDDALAALDNLDDMDFSGLEDLDELAALEDLEDIDDDAIIVEDGRRRRFSDLSPEEQARVRATMDEAREALRGSREEIRQAVRAAHDAQRTVNREEIRRAMEESRRARIESRETVREAMREAEVQMAAAREATEHMPEVRAALAEAAAEIAEAAAEARAAGDAERAQELEEAQRAIERTARNHRDHD